MSVAGHPSVKLNEVYRLLPALLGLLGIFILELPTPLGIDVWIRNPFPICCVSHLSLKPAVHLTPVLLACTGLVANAALSLMFRHQTFSSNYLLKQGTI